MARIKSIDKLPVGETRRFKDAMTLTVAFPNGHDYDFNAVVAMLRAEDGALYIEKANGGIVEIPPSYLFYEIGFPQE